MTNQKIIFGLTFTIYFTELPQDYLLKDVIHRTAKVLRNRFWLWNDIKQFIVHPTDYDATTFEVSIIFNNFYTSEDLDFFKKECANFGTDDIYEMSIPD